MSTEQPSRSQIVARARRFRALRAAQRALAPSVRSPDVFPPIEPLREIRNQLVRLLEPSKAGPSESTPADLRGIDETLDDYAHGLRAVADGVALPQFRASLSEPTREQREETGALLDLLLEDTHEISRWLSLVDYLITLLSIARHDGSWSLVVDPTNVSEVTRNLSLNAPLCDPELQAQILTRFQKASESLSSSGDFELIVKEMGAYKKKILDYFFLPEVLRCVVSYNLAVRLWHERRMSQVREEHREVDFAPPPPRAVAPPDAAPTSAAPGPDEPLDLTDIEIAVAGAVTRTDSEASGAVAAIVACLDLAGLEPQHARLLQQPGPDESARLGRRIMVLGLVLQAVPGKAAELAQAGLDPQRVEEEWLPEISDEVRAATNEMIAGNRYDEASQLSDLQSRFLFAASVAAKRTHAPEAPPAARPAAPAAPLHDVDAALAQARKGDRPPPRPITLPSVPDAATSSRRPLALTALFSLVFCLMIFNWVTANPAVKGVFSTRDLLEISPLLESGYRTADGKGPLFMGAFGGGWNDMDDSERKRLAGHVREKLARIGVREVMLYDERKALQVHYVGERNEYPGWDADESKAPSSRRSSAARRSAGRT